MMVRKCVFCGGYGVRSMNTKIGIGDPCKENDHANGEGQWEVTIDICGQCRQLTTIQMGEGVLRNQLEEPNHQIYESMAYICATLLCEYRRYYKKELRTKQWDKTSLEKMADVALRDSRVSGLKSKELAQRVLDHLKCAHKRLFLLHK